MNLAEIDRLVRDGEQGGYLAGLVALVGARHIVELGTGDGATSARIMQVLPRGATLTTVNWPNPPSGDNPRRYLAPWTSDDRLSLIESDTRSEAVAQRIPDGIDLLFIDSTHTRECADEEWRLYAPKLIDDALVVVDDLDHNDMRDFWDTLEYDKIEIRDGRAGMLRYRR